MAPEIIMLSLAVMATSVAASLISTLTSLWNYKNRDSKNIAITLPDGHKVDVDISMKAMKSQK